MLSICGMHWTFLVGGPFKNLKYRPKWKNSDQSFHSLWASFMSHSQAVSPLAINIARTLEPSHLFSYPLPDSEICYQF